MPHLFCPSYRIEKKESDTVFFYCKYELSKYNYLFYDKKLIISLIHPSMEMRKNGGKRIFFDITILIKNFYEV